ncbi:MAG: YceI family protein [Pirellulaceae bacterium]
MKISIVPTLLAVLFFTGCGATDSENPSDTPPVEAPPAASTESEEMAEVDGKVGITPDNTRIEFVGTHAPGKTEPRKGEFNKFMGHVELEDQTLKAIHVDIDTTSLKTEIEKLTNHLKSPDFFDVNEHPQASFTSTAIQADGEGKAQVTGDLTLLGKTESIQFPATYSTEDGLKLSADFMIDRTKFGMDYGQDNVEKEVQIIISVGK